jgi:hypothetical protein
MRMDLEQLDEVLLDTSLWEVAWFEPYRSLKSGF